MGRFCGVFYRVAQITLFLPPQFDVRGYPEWATKQIRQWSWGHEAMNVYGRRANTRRATDPEEIRPSYRFEVSPAEQNRSVKKSFRGALLE